MKVEGKYCLISLRESLKFVFEGEIFIYIADWRSRYQ